MSEFSVHYDNNLRNINSSNATFGKLEQNILNFSGINTTVDVSQGYFNTVIGPGGGVPPTLTLTNIPRGYSFNLINIGSGNIILNPGGATSNSVQISSWIFDGTNLIKLSETS